VEFATILSVHNARSIYTDRDGLTTAPVYNARMSHWSDDLYAVFLQLNGYMNRPDLDAAFLARAQIKLDRALYPLLVRIGNAEPINVVDLAGLVGRNHSTVSRQVDKLESLGLVERHAAAADQRVRLLKPSAAGRDMLATISNARRRFLEERVGDWTVAERNLLLDLLQRFSAKIGEVSNFKPAPSNDAQDPALNRPPILVP
jgi:DNA-binding MarR family transcriptional regulator